MARSIFPLVNNEDFIYYLRDIIDTTARYLTRLKRYSDELEEMIINQKLRNNPKMYVHDEIYCEFYDKLRHVETVLLNLIGDKSNQSLSYNKFREIADKRMSNGLNLNLEKLPVEMRQELNRFNDWRNKNLHIPLSYLSTTRDLAKQKVSDDPTRYTLIPNNPIVITQYEYQYSKVLIDMLDIMKVFYEKCRKVHQQMKKDYSKLIGESVQILHERNTVMELEDHYFINEKVHGN